MLLIRTAFSPCSIINWILGRRIRRNNLFNSWYCWLCQRYEKTQPSRGALNYQCFENIQKISRKTSENFYRKEKNEGLSSIINFHTVSQENKCAGVAQEPISFLFTHFFSMLHFNISWNYWKIPRFTRDFRGHWKGTLERNGSMFLFFSEIDQLGNSQNFYF